MKVLFHLFLRNNCGATAIEYGLLIALIGLAASVAISNFTPGLNNLYLMVDQSTRNKI